MMSLPAVKATVTFFLLNFDLLLYLDGLERLQRRKKKSHISFPFGCNKAPQNSVYIVEIKLPPKEWNM